MILQDYRLFNIAGEDATIFLQGQLTADTKNLLDNTTVYTSHLNASGKLESFFLLMRETATSYYGMVHQSVYQNCLKNLQKYAIFSTVTFQELTDLVDFNQLDTSITFLKNDISLHFILPILPVIHTIQQNECLDDYSAYCLARNIPLFTEQSINTYIPQQLSLDELGNSVSFTKGCYLGQEIVARAKYRGNTAFALLLFKFDGRQILQNEVSTQLGNEFRKKGEIITVIGNYIQATVTIKNPTDKEKAYYINSDSASYQLENI